MSVVLREDAAGACTAEARMEEVGAEEAGAEALSRRPRRHCLRNHLV